ncbi:MAG: glycosyltransferase family 2 protein [Anaerolineales bacterium]|nr:glycosyltransferase family 2 protein [Anaerolineales bacterium]
MYRVSIIVPCFNEQATIRLLLDAIYRQTIPREEMEVVIADGMSTDGTRNEISRFQQDHPDLKISVVDNHRRNIPSGLNRAIETARGVLIIRMDAHSVPGERYVAKCVESLEKGLGANVGGVWEIKPGGDGWVPRSIAIAAAHYLGVGDAKYRVGSRPQAVDTVPFGAFRRELFDRIGFYDETLLSNEDYELNVRIRRDGGVIWLDPEIKSIYFARSDFKALARQYWRYGYWKVRMLRRYPETFRWRQLSGAFVLTWIVLGGLSIAIPLARWLLAIEAAIYGTALFSAGVQAGWTRKDLRLFGGVPIAIATMHFSWGTAFLWSLIEHWVKPKLK